MNSEASMHHSDEINLLEFAETLWDGKWKVVAAVALSVLSVFGYQTNQPQSNFEASTEIKPITSVEAEKYRQSNASGFFEVSPNTLLSLYIEQLDERTLFEEAIQKYQLLDVENFEDKQAYEEAVTALAFSIEILPPINVDGAETGEVRRFWSVGFEYNDDEKWKQVLASVDLLASQAVKKILQQRFQTTLSVAKQKRDFELEDIQTQMANAKRDFDKKMEEFELKQGFQLEDIETLIENSKKDFDQGMEEFEQNHRFNIEDVTTQIENALVDYERKTANRLAFLREQAAIARKLGVSKNTIEAQMFSAQNGVVANVKTDTPFYLRGYEAIEKEIELIEAREDTRAFVSGLFELEQQKRGLEQDKTLQRAELKKAYEDGLLELERQKRGLEQDRTLQRIEKNKAYLDSLIELQKKERSLQQDRTLERAEALFATTPVMGADDFSAVSLTIGASEFVSQSKRALMLALAVALGGMVGAIYVLISSAISKRKEKVA